METHTLQTETSRLLDLVIHSLYTERDIRRQHVQIPSIGSAIKANHNPSLHFIPVGAGWAGDSGECASASACAERAPAFMQLVKEHGHSAIPSGIGLGAPFICGMC